MSAPVPALEPEFKTAGDTWTWKRALSEFPAGDWTLSYSLIPTTGEVITFDATNDGGDFLVEESAATTAAYPAGVYTLVGSVSNGTQRYEIVRKPGFVALPNTGTAGDYRTDWEKIRDNCLALLREESSRRDQSYSRNSRSMTAKDLNSIVSLYNRAVAEVTREQFRGRSRLIRGRFVSAR